MSSASLTGSAPLGGRLGPELRSTPPVPRPRLLQRLSAWVDGPVFLIHAPAGYGKTTLLGQYAAGRGRPVAWLRLTDDDDDPAVFLSDLAHALGDAGGDAEGLVARISVGSPGAVPIALPRLISWLREHPEPPTLVLDDVHHLQSPEALDVLAALCDHAPSSSALLLGGRARPALPLARLRAGGRLLELGAADLRMTPAEGAAMLRATGAQVDDAEAALVVQRTEGWPAAIYLAGLLLRDGEVHWPEGAVGPDDPHLVEYVREEVLAHAGPVDAAFLTRSSVLDELRPEICDVVLERDDSAERLRALVGANLLVTPGDGYGTTFRVHPLFRALLQAELRRTGRGEERALHRRAAAVFREHRDWERAIHHALAAGDDGDAADVIWEIAIEMIAGGRGPTLERWCGWFSEEAVATHPQIALARGWAALEAGESETASECAAITLASPRQTPLADGAPVRAMGLTLRAALGLSGNGQAAADAEEAAATTPADHPLRGIALLVLGSLALLERDAEDASGLLREAERLAVGSVPTLYAVVLAHQALLAIAGDRWDEADTYVTMARTAQRVAGVQDYSTQAVVSAAQALTLAHRGEHAQARADADQAAKCLALLRRTSPYIGLLTRVALAWARAELGEGGQARALLGEVRELSGERPPALVVAWVDHTGALIEDLAGDAGGPALTTAELRTLQYLPTHLSLREIGERLHVSRNTVKTHTVAIYRKLEVASRSEAVGRGRTLGLLDD